MNYLRKYGAKLVVGVLVSVSIMFTTSMFGVVPCLLIAIVLLWLAAGSTIGLRQRGKDHTPQF